MTYDEDECSSEHYYITARDSGGIILDCREVCIDEISAVTIHMYGGYVTCLPMVFTIQ